MTSLETFPSTCSEGAPHGRGVPHMIDARHKANKAIYIYSASRGWILYPWTGIGEIRGGREREGTTRRENIAERRTARLSIRENRTIPYDRFVRLIRARSHKMTLARSSGPLRRTPSPLPPHPWHRGAREATPENYCCPYTFVRISKLGPGVE